MIDHISPELKACSEPGKNGKRGHGSGPTAWFGGTREGTGSGDESQSGDTNGASCLLELFAFIQYIIHDCEWPSVNNSLCSSFLLYT
jgi:hypothetical protein